MSDMEIVARIERRRKWTLEEKAALVAEVEAEGGKVKLVARRLPAPEPPRSPPPGEGRAGAIEIALPDGARVSVDAFVDEKALSRVLRAMKGSP